MKNRSKHREEIKYLFSDDNIIIEFDVITILGAKHTTQINITINSNDGYYLDNDYEIIEKLLETINNDDIIDVEDLINSNTELNPKFLYGFIGKLRMINDSINSYFKGY